MIQRKDLPALLTSVMATLAGIGITRFAYTSLLPALIEAQWFSASQAVYLGAANLLGYFFGALSAHFLTERYSKRAVIGASFTGIALSFLLCAGPFSFAWFSLWRLISGVAGGVLMVVGPSLALSATPADRRTNVGALVFTGIGLGALLSASVVPVLLEASLMATWATLGLLCCVAGILCDRGVTHLAAPPLPSAEEVSDQGGHTGIGMVVMLVIGAYALDAVGFVPHTSILGRLPGQRKRSGTACRLLAMGYLWCRRYLRALDHWHNCASSGLAPRLGSGISGKGSRSDPAGTITSVLKPGSLLVRGRRHDPRHRGTDVRPPRRAGGPHRAQENLGQSHCRLRRRTGHRQLWDVRAL